MRAHLPLPVSVSPARLAGLLLAVAPLAAAGLLLHARQADADHRGDATLHVCAKENSGKLRLGEDCRRREVAHVLATEDGLDAAEARISELESQVANLEGANTNLEDRVATLEGDLAAATDRIATLETELGAATDRIDTLESDLADAESRITTLEEDESRAPDIGARVVAEFSGL